MKPFDNASHVRLCTSVVRAVLTGAAFPLTVRDVEYFVYGLGHRDINTYDVRDALRELEKDGVVVMTNYKFSLAERGHGDV